MAKKLKPANIALLSPKKQDLSFLRQVQSLNTYEGATEAFDPNGFFSVETFGKVGEKTRMVRFGYIDAKLGVIHPHIYKNLHRLKSLYTDILAGRGYAKWDAKAKDFIPSDPNEGETGYSFFMSHWEELKIKGTESLKRDNVIKMIDDYRQDAIVNHIMVLPAGLRELEFKDGRPTEDEINGLYRRLLAVTQTVNDRVKPNDPVNDSVRFQIQKAFNDIFENLFERIEGKSGFIQSRMMARGVWHATRNVITAMDSGAGDLFGPTAPKPTEYALGLYQYVHSILPLFMYQMRTLFLKDKTWGQQYATLIDKKTLKPKEVELTPKNTTLYGSEEGLERLAHRFGTVKWRSEAAKIQGAYLKLICDLGDGFYLLDSIDDVREDNHKEHIRPMTWGEVFYYACQPVSSRTPVESTRYPISEEGSSVMTRTSLRTTLPPRQMRERIAVAEDGTIETKLYPYWPAQDTMIWLESSQPHPSRHAGYNADHDGDTLGSIVSMAKEVNDECEDYYNSWESLYGSNGELTIDFNMDLSEWTIIGATAKNVEA